jgi:hypothetical protein
MLGGLCFSENRDQALPDLEKLCSILLPQKAVHLILRNFTNRSWHRFEQVGLRRSWRRNSSQPRRLFGTGSNKPNWPGCAKKTSSFGWKGKSCQKPRPVSHGRPMPFHQNLRIRECVPGLLSSENPLTCTERFHQPLLRMAAAAVVTACTGRSEVEPTDP